MTEIWILLYIHGKKKLTKCNPSTLRKDLRVMKLDFDEYFSGRIRKVVQAIWSKLT